MKRKQEAIAILVVSFVASLIPALLMGDILAAMQFALTFTGLVVLPMLPWVLMLDISTLAKFGLSVVAGLAGIPIIFFFIGVVGGPLTLPVFIGVPLVVLIVGLYLLKKSKKSQ